jgi:hypothetical protein
MSKDSNSRNGRNGSNGRNDGNERNDNGEILRFAQDDSWVTVLRMTEVRRVKEGNKERKAG